jgi:hypothetical protein
MTAWLLIVHLSSVTQGIVTIPGIASQQECERLNDVLIKNWPNHFRPRVATPPARLTNDARCVPYEMAPNETQARH